MIEFLKEFIVMCAVILAACVVGVPVVMAIVIGPALLLGFDWGFGVTFAIIIGLVAGQLVLEMRR